MQRRRFYAAPDERDQTRIMLSADESHHLLQVLRLSCGAEVFVFDGCGTEFRCELIAQVGKRAVLEIIEELTDAVESPLRLTLAQALVKGEKFDFIVQKATELGVHRIVPLACEHADLKLNRESAAKKIERWQRISMEALKQCGRRARVAIDSPLTVAEFLCADEAAATAAMLFFNERGGAVLQQTLEALTDQRTISVLIGPEGGWSNHEIALMNNSGCRAVTLGKRILRTETAALVALTLLQHRLGDLSR
ncbi:MAG: 16S rRNA (uracil(1498)-N(3))-methyltransferase [Acidobacteria bacterium]|nr:16S rRNA (uracil(1498)-N(3))-methyltransferase [Acidobacteriota bacterium]